MSGNISGGSLAQACLIPPQGGACSDGSTISIEGYTGDLGGGGSAVVNGTIYPSVIFQVPTGPGPFSSFTLLTNSFTLNGAGTYSVPFTIESPAILEAAVPGALSTDVLFDNHVTGSGVATVNFFALPPGVGQQFDFNSITWDFGPTSPTVTPEPSSMVWSSLQPLSDCFFALRSDG